MYCLIFFCEQPNSKIWENFFFLIIVIYQVAELMNNWSLVNNNYFIKYIYYLFSNTVNISLVSDRLSFITIRYAADSLSWIQSKYLYIIL